MYTKEDDDNFLQQETNKNTWLSLVWEFFTEGLPSIVWWFLQVEQTRNSVEAGCVLPLIDIIDAFDQNLLVIKHFCLCPSKQDFKCQPS